MHRKRKEFWPDFKFPGLNLWNAPLSPEMLRLYNDLAKTKTIDRAKNEIQLA